MTNEPLKQLFIDTVNETKGSIAKAVELAMKEAPELCDQLIRFTIARDVLSVIGFVIVAAVIFRAGRRMADSEEDDFYTYLFGAASMFPLFLAGAAIIHALKAYIAPKLFLIEYAVSLFK